MTPQSLFPFTLLLLLLPSTLTNGKELRNLGSCFPDEVPRATNTEFSRNVAKFGIKLFKNFMKDNIGGVENVVVAPLSVWSALVLLYMGAESRTEDEIRKALKLNTKTGTHSEWVLLHQQLAGGRMVRQGPLSTTTNQKGERQAKQTSSGSQTRSASASQDASQTSSSSSSQTPGDGGTKTISIKSNSKVERCAIDRYGVTRCLADDGLTRSEDSTVTDAEGSGSSGSSSSSSSSSPGISSSSTKTCTNGVCETTSNSGVSGMKQSESCATDADGVKVCTKETCTTDSTGTETCSTETCTTDETGTETCTTARSAKKTKKAPVSETAGGATRDTMPKTETTENSATNAEEAATLPISEAPGTSASNIEETATLPISEAPGTSASNIEETATLPTPETTGNSAINVGETTKLPMDTNSATSKNCTTDSNGMETCPNGTCTTNGTGNTNCTSEETPGQMNDKVGKAQGSGNSFTSENWAYISQSLDLKPCLPDALPEITPIDFSNTPSAAQTINSEVERVTQGMITSLVEPQDLVGAEFLILNAVHFKGEWMTAFPVENTQMEPFYTAPPPADPAGNVEMMRVVGNFKYAANTNLEASALLLPYTSSFALLLLLPDNAKSGVDRVIERLNFNRLTGAMNKLKDNEVEVSLPKFSVTSHHSDALKQAVFSSGVKRLFQGPINLSALTSASLRLQSIIQQAAITVDEQGTTFGTATGILGTRVGPVKVRFDRPFLFLLMDTEHNIPLAGGAYRKPTMA